jgi:uncharacterized damage-inducible protein DinB
MPQQTMTERDAYLDRFEKEYQTTLRVLRAYPTERADLKPTEKMKSARELAWMLVLNQKVVEPVINGDLRPGSFPGAPDTMEEVVDAFQKSHRDAVDKFGHAKDEDLNATVKLPVAPKQVEERRRLDALWFFLNDTIHHRGQFSVYLRLAGAKVPSIYGPTADEPWS